MDGSAHSYAARSNAPGAELRRTDVTHTPLCPLELRRLATVPEYAEAVELQRITWGESFRDIVPAAILKITQRVGGVTAGAFDSAGQLIGFVYGLTGFYDRRLVHWSHMLAVRPEFRDRGVGRRLKEYQRELLITAGIEWMYWTVDPLVARNAHLNLNRLRAEVREYVPDMYGDTGSSLHAFGTDRFVLMWPVSSELPVGHCRLGDAPRPHSSHAEGALLNEMDDEALGVLLAAATRPCVVRVEIPSDIEVMAVGEARVWRKATRRVFVAALRGGYQVSGFCRASEGHCFYLLSSAVAH
jgi:predicted GNAT superfamily acetyltransferase